MQRFWHKHFTMERKYSVVLKWMGDFMQFGGLFGCLVVKNGAVYCQGW